jgi:hypothetical protein
MVTKTASGAGFSLIARFCALQLYMNIRCDRPFAVALTDLTKDDVIVPVDQKGWKDRPSHAAHPSGDHTDW